MHTSTNYLESLSTQFIGFCHTSWFSSYSTNCRHGHDTAVLWFKFGSWQSRAGISKIWCLLAIDRYCRAFKVRVFVPVTATCKPGSDCSSLMESHQDRQPEFVIQSQWCIVTQPMCTRLFKPGWWLWHFDLEWTVTVLNDKKDGSSSYLSK